MGDRENHMHPAYGRESWRPTQPTQHGTPRAGGPARVDGQTPRPQQRQTQAPPVSPSGNLRQHSPASYNATPDHIAHYQQRMTHDMINIVGQTTDLVNRLTGGLTQHTVQHTTTEQAGKQLHVTPLHFSSDKYGDIEQTATCRAWADGNCDEPCPGNYAHHFFPVVVQRAHREGFKSRMCEYAKTGSCHWPDDICGFTHVDATLAGVNEEFQQAAKDGQRAQAPMTKDDDGKEAVEIKGRRKGFRTLIEAQPYLTKMLFYCKACKEPFLDLASVLKHSEMSTPCRESIRDETDRDDSTQQGDRSVAEAEDKTDEVAE